MISNIYSWSRNHEEYIEKYTVPVNYLNHHRISPESIRFFRRLMVTSWDKESVCSVDIGDTVEIASGGSAEENYLAQVEYFYDIGTPSDSKFAVVAWFVKQNELPSSKIPQDCSSNEVFLSKIKACCRTIDAETIIGKVSVQFALHPDFMTENSEGLPSYYYRRSYNGRHFKDIECAQDNSQYQAPQSKFPPNSPEKKVEIVVFIDKKPSASKAATTSKVHKTPNKPSNNISLDVLKSPVTASNYNKLDVSAAALDLLGDDDGSDDERDIDSDDLDDEQFHDAVAVTQKPKGILKSVENLKKISTNDKSARAVTPLRINTKSMDISKKGMIVKRNNYSQVEGKGEPPKSTPTVETQQKPSRPKPSLARKADVDPLDQMSNDVLKSSREGGRKSVKLSIKSSDDVAKCILRTPRVVLKDIAKSKTKTPSVTFATNRRKSFRLSQKKRKKFRDAGSDGESGLSCTDEESDFEAAGDSDSDNNEDSDSGDSEHEDPADSDESVFNDDVPYGRKSRRKSVRNSSSVRSRKRKSAVTPLVIKTPRNRTPYIPSRKTPLKVASSVFDVARDKLHVSAVPESLPCRESEFQTIYSFVEGKISSKTGGCMYISGVPGTGKTATVMEVISSLNQSVEDEFFEDFNYIEINGMKLTEPHQAYVSIYKQLTGQKVSSSQSAQELLTKHFEKGSKKSTILLVDELDLLWTRKQDVLYHIFDWPSRSSARLIVLAIANTMDLPERVMMNRVSSRLGLTRVSFLPYNFRQLQEIVSSRLQGIPAFDRDAIQLVSRKVAAVSGDARRCLDICRRAIEIAVRNKTEGKELEVAGVEHVHRALQEMFSSPMISYIRSCSTHEQIFLRAVVCEFRRSGIEETTIGALVSHHTSLSKLEGLPPITVSSLLTVCYNLAASRLILVESERNDLYTRIRLNLSIDDVMFAINQ